MPPDPEEVTERGQNTGTVHFDVALLFWRRGGRGKGGGGRGQRACVLSSARKTIVIPFALLFNSLFSPSISAILLCLSVSLKPLAHSFDIPPADCSLYTHLGAAKQTKSLVQTVSTCSLPQEAGGNVFNYATKPSPWIVGRNVFAVKSLLS